MKRATWFTLFAATVCTMLLSTSAPAAIAVFGTGVNQFNMDFVEIGSPGNAADIKGVPNPAGAVDYTYFMGKYEVSRDMINKANATIANGGGSLAITLANMSFYGGNGENRPATGVSWNEAARFVNWLNVSQNFPPAYKFAAQPGDAGYSADSNIQLWSISDPGYNVANPFRNSRANYFLPSVDEWYKAAFYDPIANGGLGGYWNYATGSGIDPIAVASGTTAGTAVFFQPFENGPADIFNAGGLSPFGVMGMSGNVWEREETELDLVNNSPSSDRGIRGGDWNDGFLLISSDNRGNGSPAGVSSFVGFRVASLSPVPEPSTYVLVSMGLSSLGLYQWRRNRK